MKAVVADRLGAGWRIAERPDPEPGPRDLLIQVEASGVCYTDVHELRDPAYGATFPRIPGHEPVGVIIARGEAVDEWEPGDRVGIAYAQGWCGHCEFCAEGRYEFCARALQTGVTVDGGHAELLIVDAGSVERVPKGLDPVEAAPLFCAGFTAYSGIRDAGLRPGERCAVVGVGGLGHLAIQYAAALGAEVVAVTRSPEKRAQLEELGAHEVVVAGGDGHGTGEALRRAGPVDVMIHTGNGLTPDLLRGMKVYGRIALVGGSHDSLTVTPIEMLFAHLTIVGSTQGPRHRLREVLELHARAGARTIIEPYPLSKALDAYENVETGQARFRAVIVP
jgi:D-arabinose 1-dehydrogenase-like Zn-dependent alcohol dehydrogenase